MKTYKKNILLMSVLGFSTIYSNVTSAAECTVTPITDTIPLVPANISVGSDMPDGTVVYRMNSFAKKTLTAGCSADPTEKYSISSVLVLRNEPHPLSNWSGNPFPGRVYETNIPGIGVSIWYAFRASTIATPEVIQTLDIDGPSTALLLNDFDISFVKIGPVSPGTITGADIPGVKIELRSPTNNVTTFPLTLRDVDFTGAINITVPSCQTPDVSINMGEHEIRTVFSGPGSTTDWVKADFSLINCPVFYGYYDNSRYPQHYNDTNTVNVPNSIPNLLTVTVAPFTSVIDADNGIFAVDTSSSESGSGVGIQLGYDSGAITPVKLNTPFTYTTNSNGNPTITLPFRARYIQTEKVITPGKANGRVSVTINYN